MKKLQFFIPVVYQGKNKTKIERFTEKVDAYFYLRGKKARVIRGHIKGKAQGTALFKGDPLKKTALKIASYFTLFIPLFALIVKCILRKYHNFYVIDQKKTATKIQQAFRTHKARSDLKKSIAAIKIQRAYRKHYARSKLKQLRKTNPSLWKSLMGSVLSTVTNPQLVNAIEKATGLNIYSIGNGASYSFGAAQLLKEGRVKQAGYATYLALVNTMHGIYKAVPKGQI